ncbi:MAG: WD40/YVTN/BNR-like repeat-containing protein, partial [Anaerolineales bacterium]
YIADWATNVPAPDDIWIAHWYLTRYDPDATVWNALCLDEPAPMYWLHNQRLRQYAGGHSETWGGVPLTIDSNVLEGEVNFLPATEPATSKILNGAQVQTINPVLRDLQFLDSVRGWLLADNSQLLWTQNGGITWRDIAPAVYSEGRILDASFTDRSNGWVVGLPGDEPALTIALTADGGVHWAESRLPLDAQEVAEIAAASLETLDSGQVFAALKLQSGSSFSRGRLFTSPDDGRIWEERALPLGEPVVFLDAAHGWTAGGAAGNELYHTQDGGYTWQAQDLDLPRGVRVEVGLPRFDERGQGWLPVLLYEATGRRLQVYTSQAGGQSWGVQQTTYSDDVEPGLHLDHLMAGTPQRALKTIPLLPQGTVAADLDDEGTMWAITQSGTCQDGLTSDASYGVRCVQDWQLMRSPDGGQTWEEILLE